MTDQWWLHAAFAQEDADAAGDSGFTGVDAGRLRAVGDQGRA